MQNCGYFIMGQKKKKITVLHYFGIVELTQMVTFVNINCCGKFSLLP